MIFFQLFYTLPLYHHNRYQLTPFHTGLFMTLNGLMICFLEMPIVSYFERKKVHKVKIILWGSLLMAASFYVLLAGWIGVLVISILFITFGEMFAFPFSNSFAMSRAPKGHEGRYMALYKMSFSLAQIMSSKAGLSIIGKYGFQANWLFMGSLGILSALAALYLQKVLHNKEVKKLKI
jgi:MFS family permease